MTTETHAGAGWTTSRVAVTADGMERAAKAMLKSTGTSPTAQQRQLLASLVTAGLVRPVTREG